MTNLQSGAPQGPDPMLQRLLVAGPALAGAILAGGVLLGLGLPAWQEVQAGQQRVEKLRSLEQQLPLLRRQLETERRRSEMASLRQKTLLQLIAGSGNLSTFLSEVDRLAARSGVRLDLYEPAAAPSPDSPASQASSSRPANPSDPNAAKPSPPDPLLSQGLEKRSLMLMARGSMPQLLAFLRGLEGLSVLVAQSDLNLDLEEIKAAQPQQVTPAANPVPPSSTTTPPEKKLPTWVALKLSVALYEKGHSGVSRAAATRATNPTVRESR